jgi:hypothetical protein
MANTVFKVENGLLVLGSANVVGSLTVGSEFNITGNITFSGTSNGDFRPINNTYSLGNSSNRWSLSALDIDVNGTTALSNTLSVAGQATFSSNVIPSANNVKLGDTNRRWDLYANNANVLTFGVSSLTAANITVSNTATVSGTLVVNPGVANAVVVTGNSTHSNITFTSNSTQFFSNVIFDTNVLFVDATNNRVGIATLTPDAALTVSGTANVSGAVVLGSTLDVNSALTVSNNGVFTGTVNASAGFNTGANVVVSTTLVRVGNTTVNSSITSSAIFTSGIVNAGNTTIAGFANVSGVLSTGNTTVTGFANVSGVFAAGNTTVTGFANVSGTLTVVGNTTITTGKLTVNGDVTSTGSFDSTSDFRVKTNIRPIDNALDTVLKLDGVLYDRTDNNQKDQMGLIAQQILPHVPQVVNGNEQDGYTVSYPNLVALLIEAVKDLNKKVNSTEK